jgi:hypothetical protein
MKEEKYKDDWKDYVKSELLLSDEERERIFDWFQENKVKPNLPDLCPMTTFKVEYQFSGLGVAKVLHIGDKEFIINEEDLENL